MYKLHCKLSLWLGKTNLITIAVSSPRVFLGIVGKSALGGVTKHTLKLISYLYMY